MPIAEHIALLDLAYRCFDEQRIDDALALMAEDVEWPAVANGTVLPGREAVRRYWEAQLAVARPNVVPTQYLDAGNDVVAVVDQRVDGLDGITLVPTHVVHHRYTFRDSLVRRMVVFDTEAEALDPGGPHR